jgi:hypothetical protein
MNKIYVTIKNFSINSQITDKKITLNFLRHEFINYKNVYT